MNKIETKNIQETQLVAKRIAQEILEKKESKAIILALNGSLGAGKTVFAQGFAKGLKIKEPVLSPTFIIFRKFALDLKKFNQFYHFDVYRIENSQELEVLGFQEIINNPKNIVLIEWADKIKDILPKETIFINLKLVDSKSREITISNLKNPGLKPVVL